MGGAVAAIEKGFMQKEITESAYQFQKEIEAKKRIVVGVNEFLSEEKVPMKILRVNPKVEKKLRQRLTQIKKQRNKPKVEEALSSLRRAAEKEEVNLMPLIIKAVSEYATLGEVCDALREVFGEYKPSSIF